VSAPDRGELIVYRTEDGQAEVQLKTLDGSVWLNQGEMAELFDTTKQNISLHIKNILKDGELPEASVVKEYLTTAEDGKRYQTMHYNLHMILAVGYRVRKHDVIVTKNYLSADEVDTLNRLVVIFLEQAELRVKERKPLTLDYWRQNVDRLLAFNEKAVLTHTGSISREAMERVACERFDAFDENRRIAEARQADAEEIAELERIEKQLERKKGK